MRWGSSMHALHVSPETIQSIVGHADVGMTKHYLHIQDSIRQDAIDRFNKAFPAKRSEPNKSDDDSGKIIPFPNVG